MVFPLAAQSQTERWEWNHMWGGGMYFGWMMWLWIAILVFFVVWVVKYTSGRNNDGGVVTTDNAALVTLKKRLANGEIDEKEYQTIKQTLES